MEDLLSCLISGGVPTQDMIENELYEICCREHSNCNYECPVFAANGCARVGAEKPFGVNRGCDCFKNGHEMFIFLKSKLAKTQED